MRCDNCESPILLGIRVGIFRYCEDCAPDEDPDEHWDEEEGDDA